LVFLTGGERVAQFMMQFNKNTRRKVPIPSPTRYCPTAHLLSSQCALLFSSVGTAQVKACGLTIDKKHAVKMQ